MNRHIWNRTYSGVGGWQGKPCLLPDYNPLDSGFRRNDGEGNRNVLIVPLTIVTQKRDACLLVAGTSDNNLNIQGSDE